MKFLLNFLDLFRSILVDVYYELRFFLFKTFKGYFQTVSWFGEVFHTFVKLSVLFEPISICFGHWWYSVLDCDGICLESWNETLLAPLYQIFYWTWYSLAHYLLVLFWRVLIFIIITLMRLYLNLNLGIFILARFNKSWHHRRPCFAPDILHWWNTFDFESICLWSRVLVAIDFGSCAKQQKLFLALVDLWFFSLRLLDFIET